MIFKNRHSLYKLTVPEKYGSLFMIQWAQNMQKTLYTGTDHDLIRAADHTSGLLNIFRQYFPEFLFPLRFSIRKQSLILTHCALHISPP